MADSSLVDALTLLERVSQESKPYGWLCPRCGAANSPWVMYCQNCPRPAPQQPMATDCGCPDTRGCMSTICPRRVVVTY